MNPPIKKELDKIQDILIDEVDRLFPKIKKQGGNKGRGEACVLVGVALKEIKKLFDKQDAKFSKRIKGIIGKDDQEIPGKHHDPNVVRNRLRGDQRNKLEQCFCQSYFDDDHILQDCTCGKCK